MSRKQSVDHKLTNALVVILSRRSTYEQIVHLDGVFLTFHASIIPYQTRDARTIFHKFQS